MSNRTLVFLIGITFASVIYLLIENYMPAAESLDKGTFIAPNDVRGMAVIHKDIPYTLNFEQQNTIVNDFNNAKPLSANALGSATGGNLNTIQKIEIYRFNNQSPIEIFPIKYVEDNLVFSAPLWYSEYLMEQSRGKLKALLSETYDH